MSQHFCIFTAVLKNEYRSTTNRSMPNGKRFEERVLRRSLYNGTRYELSDLNNALEALKSGGVILYPTDTVWGIGCDATNAEAVSRVFAIKQRNDAKALISIVHSNGALGRWMKRVPDIAYDLIETATSPLTIVYPEVEGLAANLVAEDGSAGIRVVDEPFCKKMCERFGRPIVSTSANISGAPTPSTFQKISREIIEKVDYVVEYRQKDKNPGEASNIIKLDEKGHFQIIR